MHDDKCTQGANITLPKATEITQKIKTDLDLPEKPIKLLVLDTLR